jgi:hypothetical protein
MAFDMTLKIQKNEIEIAERIVRQGNVYSNLAVKYFFLFVKFIAFMDFYNARVGEMKFCTYA